MAGPSTSIEVSIQQLLDGRLIRDGADLSITSTNLSGETETVLLKDYFLTSPDLATTTGILKSNIVNLLAIGQPLDHGMLAFEDPQAIGKITTADGAVSVQRMDQSIQLNEGDFIYLNDIVSSNTSAVGIAFADQTTMSVDPNSTMVIDDFVYDPENPTTGSMNANVLEGNFSFVSGQIAKVGNDAMKVTTPVLTIGVRGTQVAGKANTEGEDNEIVLLPNEDGTVGQIMIKNESGEVLLTKAYEATIITDPYTVPTVPVILQKTEVLKKFATTIATTRKTEKIAKVERETEEAVKQKEEAEEEKEELEEEKEKLEEEAEELEEEKEELEEKVEELEEEKEEVAEEKEEIEEKLEEVFEEKEEIEEKKEAVAEEIEELEEKLEEVPVAEKEKIEQELQKLEEEFEEIEEEAQEIEKEIEVVAKEKVEVEKKVREIEKEFEQVQEDFTEIEQNIEVIEKEVLQVIEKEQVIEQEIKFVEEKFDAIVEEFEVFQKEFVQEFEDFIPEEEIQQFIEEAPIELIEEFQENIIEKLEEEKINVQENENEVAKDEDPFAEENVEKKLDELDEKQEELIEKADELMEKDMQLQEEAKQLEEEAKALEEEAQQLEKEAEEAYRNNDEEAIAEIEQKFEELDEEFKQIDDSFQEIDEQYQEINEDFDQLNEEFISIDEEFQEVFQTNESMPIRIPEDGPMYNEDNDVFDVPEDEQVEVNVEEFIQEEKQKVIENNVFAEEADNFFQSDEMQDVEVDENVKDMFIINTSQIDEFITGPNIDSADDYYAQEDEMDDFFYVVDNNEELYNTALEADDWFDQFIADLAEEQNINVAPWLDMPNDTTVSESLSTNSTLGYVYASDANGDQLTYSILSDASGKIAIDGNRLYLNSAFDDVSANTNYSVLLKVTDPYGASDVDEWIVTVSADQVLSTQLSKSVTYGDIATWGAKFSEDTVQDNLWANKTALVISNADYGNLRTNVVDLLEAEGLTVTTSTNQNSIDTWAEVNSYSQIWNLNWADHSNSGSPGAYSTNVKNAYEDYLQAGGSLYLGGELNGSIYNVINNSVVSAVQQVGGDMSYGSTTTSAVDLNAAYRVGPITSSTSGKITPSAAVISTSDGSYMTSNNISAEWGPDVLNNNIQGTVMAHMDFNYAMGTGWVSSSQRWSDMVSTYSNWLQQESENNAAIATVDSEVLPIFRSVGWGAGVSVETVTSGQTMLEVDAFHLGDNVYIGGGYGHIDWAWDDSEDTAYWAFNADMDGAPAEDDDHYGVIGYDRDGDGDLWETTDTFDLDKIYIVDDSEDYMAQDSDAHGPLSFYVSPVTYSGGSWTVETDNAVHVHTTDYNQYLDLSSNTNFDDINYALIQCESALISEVVVTA